MATSMRDPRYHCQHPLNSGQYAQLVHRLYLRTGDPGQLRRFYGSVRSAIRYQYSLDDDGCGLVHDQPHVRPGEGVAGQPVLRRLAVGGHVELCGWHVAGDARLGPRSGRRIRRRRIRPRVRDAPVEGSAQFRRTALEWPLLPAVERPAARTFERCVTRQPVDGRVVRTRAGPEQSLPHGPRQCRIGRNSAAQYECDFLWIDQRRDAGGPALRHASPSGRRLRTEHFRRREPLRGDDVSIPRTARHRARSRPAGCTKRSQSRRVRRGTNAACCRAPMVCLCGATTTIRTWRSGLCQWRLSANQRESSPVDRSFRRFCARAGNGRKAVTSGRVRVKNVGRAAPACKSGAFVIC